MIIEEKTENTEKFLHSFLSDFLDQVEVVRMVAFCGAGISAPSGIPTFRGSPGSLWSKYRPEELANIHSLMKNPDLVWNWYKWRIEKIFNSKPNAAHQVLAELEQEGLLMGVITQNVDPYHELAGNKTVIHLHGTIIHARCLNCNNMVEWKKPPETVPPTCELCGSLLRPNVVFFGEALPVDAMKRASELFGRANLMLVIGTSGVVYPAASYVPEFRRISRENRIIEFNIDATPLTPMCDLTMKGDVSKTLPMFKQAMSKIIQSLAT